jgi:hypothetical protein
VGLKLAVLAAALLAATSLSRGADFLQTRELPDGSFAEPGQPGYPQLTSWATLGLTAAGAAPQARALTVKYLVAHEAQLTTATDLALAVLAERALGQNVDRPLARLLAMERSNGSFGGLVNGTAWSLLAFRGNGSTVHAATIRWLLARQTRAGGWSWSIRTTPQLSSRLSEARTSRADRSTAASGSCSASATATAASS